MLERERLVAVEAVRDAVRVCQNVRARGLSGGASSKSDGSVVTVADFASQAVISSRIAEAFAQDRVLGEEDASDLRGGPSSNLSQRVCDEVSDVIGRPVVREEVFAWIDRAALRDEDAGRAPARRFWTVDPIDGTSGFVRGDQYAVALALIIDGEVVLGVLGCPNLALPGGQRGSSFVAVRGKGACAVGLDEGGAFAGRPVQVDEISAVAEARVCESVDAKHSDHDAWAEIARTLGVHRAPLRLDSQAKYAAVASGMASAYVRLPTRADYRERIWDHAAGMLLVQEAGGCVTDVAGDPLDFSAGPTLARNRGVVATNGLLHTAVIQAIKGQGSPPTTQRR
jgi:3'(2'), 5'-bisphosphate nucleotidase